MLLRSGASVQLVAPEIHADLQRLLGSAPHVLLQREFAESDLNSVKLVIAATDDTALNQHVFDLASRRNLPVNVVDQPELCSFIFPSIVDRSPLIVAVSSGGNAPVLARLLRARLETLIPSAYGSLVQLLGKYRELAKARFASLSHRMRFWENIVNGPVAELMMS